MSDYRLKQTIDGLERLANRLDIAAQPWRSEGGYGGTRPVVVLAGDWVVASTNAEEADFIVAACNAVPDLVAEVRQLRKTIAKVDKLLGGWSILGPLGRVVEECQAITGDSQDDDCEVG